MGLETDPTSDKCQEEEETMEHLLTKCPFYAKERDETIGRPITNMETIRNGSLRNITNFIKRTGKLKME